MPTGVLERPQSELVVVEVLRFASATAYMFVVSGWLVLAAFFGPRKFRLLDTLALSFITSLAVTSLIAAVAHVAGGSLEAVGWGHLVLSVAGGTVAFLRRNSEPIAPLAREERRWEVGAATIVASTVVLAWVESLWYRMSDLFYHIAAVASLLTNNQPLVTDPFFGLRSLPVDPTAGTFHTFLALAARIGGISAFQAFEWLSPVVVAFDFLAFYCIARRMLGSAAKAVFALALFVAVVWQLDFRVVIYSKWLDPAVYWMGLFFLLMLMERFDWRALVFTSIFAVTTALVHLATAELWVFTMLAVVFFSLVFMRWTADGKGVTWRCALGAGVSTIALVPVVYQRSISVLLGAKTSVFNPPANSPMSDLPFLSLGRSLGIIRGGTLYQWYQGGDPMILFVVLGLALIVVQVVKRGGKPETIMLAAQTAIMPVLMLNLVGTKIIVTKYWFHLRRMAYVLRSVPAVLLPWAAGQTRDEWRRGPRAVVVLGVCAITAGTIAFAGIEVIGVFNRFINPLSLDNFARQRHNVVRQMEGASAFLQASAKPSGVVAAPEKTSYYLAGLVPARVIGIRRPHMPLAVEVRSGPGRRYDQTQIFHPDVTPNKTARLLEKYHVTYVVTAANSAALAKFDRMTRLRLVYQDRRFVVYEAAGSNSSLSWRPTQAL